MRDRIDWEMIFNPITVLIIAFCIIMVAVVGYSSKVDVEKEKTKQLEIQLQINKGEVVNGTR